MRTTLHITLTEYRLRIVRIGVGATFLVLGALLPYVLIPGEDRILRGPALSLLGVALAGVVLVSVLPWRRLFERGVGVGFMYAWSVLDILLITLLIATAGQSHMEIFVLYAFTTLFAASYPVRGQVGLLLFTEACYLGMMALQGWPIEGPDMVARMGSLAVLAWMASFLSRELIQAMASSARSGDESERRARLLAIVADTARSLPTLDSREVLAGVVEGAGRLGFEGASLALFDDDARTYRVVHAVGLPVEYATQTHPSDRGMPAMVLEHRRTVVMDDYRSHPRALPRLAEEGFRAVLATPVWAHGDLAAVLIGGTRNRRELADEDVEAFELLAAVAGRALEHARAFEDQRRTNERLAELDRLKSDFLSNVSHELRTPITAIQGMGTTLEQLWAELDEPDRRELLSRLNANATSLHQIISTLLDFSQLEAGSLPVQWQDVDLVALIRGLTQRLGSVLTTHPLELDLPERVEVHGDAILLERVIENLLANAVKHTPEGTPVMVSVAREGDRAAVSVSDAGPGIPEAELPHLTDRFFRGGDPNTRRTRGTGLGLALVHEILVLHDSRLEVDSRLRDGTRFSFRLRLAVRAGVPSA